MSKNKLLAQLETKVEAKGAVVTHSEPESVIGQIPFTCMADPQFQMRGGFKNPMVDAAMPLFGMVMRVRKLDALPNIVEVRKLVHIQITAIVQERYSAYCKG
ncbi:MULTISPECIES: hypothetical protein [unclassified Pseudomonas]|uniref:hypothetical protein n=1 Tax=unclassified Pseudomonas TaxID=196821 RepID=UPI00382242F8